MDEEEQGEARPPKIDEATFDSRLRALSSLSTQIEETKEELKDLQSQLDDLSWGLANYMLTTGCSKKVLDGVTYTQKQRVFSKVEDKEALRQWIEEHQATDLLMTVHPSKLTGYCNECLENGTEVPNGVNPNYIKYFVSVKG